MSKALRVVFDLDDTLYPERAFALSGFAAASAWASGEWGVEDLTEALAFTVLLDDGTVNGEAHVHQ